VVAPGQVDQFAADLQRRQAKEFAQRLWRCRLQGTAQADHTALKDVAAPFPAPPSALVLEHLPRQTGQPFTGGVDQLRASRLVAGPEAVQTALEVDRGFAHGGPCADPASHVTRSGAGCKELQA